MYILCYDIIEEQLKMFGRVSNILKFCKLVKHNSILSFNALFGSLWGSSCCQNYEYGQQALFVACWSKKLKNN